MCPRVTSLDMMAFLDGIGNYRNVCLIIVYIFMIISVSFANIWNSVREVFIYNILIFGVGV